MLNRPSVSLSIPLAPFPSLPSLHPSLPPLPSHNWYIGASGPLDKKTYMKKGNWTFTRAVSISVYVCGYLSSRVCVFLRTRVRAHVRMFVDVQVIRFEMSPKSVRNKVGQMVEAAIQYFKLHKTTHEPTRSLTIRPITSRTKGFRPTASQ